MNKNILPRHNPQSSQKIIDISRLFERNINPNISETIQLDSILRVINDFDGADTSIEVIEDRNFNDQLDDQSEIYGSASGKIVDEGFEAIAFYKSFRFISSNPAPGYWGIFFIKPRVTALLREMVADTGKNALDCKKTIIKFLYGHELYHYKIDAICLQQESFSNQLIYRPHRNYVSSLSINDWYEEAMANYYGITSLENLGRTSNPTNFICGSELIGYIKDLVSISPGAYKLGGFSKKYIHNQSGPKGLLAEQIIQGYLGKNPNSNLALMLPRDVLFQQITL